jgi:NAD(P)H dehydrogenase (quinone)
MSFYALTGATGQLGSLVMEDLLNRVAPEVIVALVRDPSKAQIWADCGVDVRLADYDQPETLTSALQGVDRLLLISGNAIGQRVPQHRAVIDAAVSAGVGFVAYTSILHAPVSTIGLAQEHRETESALAASGLPHALLRNGWYNENYTESLAQALAAGALIGASGDGRISAASRADYAQAAVEVLCNGAGGEIHELAGDNAFTMTEFAKLVSAQAGRTIPYIDMPRTAYAEALMGAGLPEAFADVLANASVASGDDALFDDGKALSRLIGRSTTPIAASIANALI